MAKFTYSEAQNLLRHAEANTPNTPEFIVCMLRHIRQKDPRFTQRLQGVSHGDFLDLIDFYSWFYRYFVGE